MRTEKKYIEARNKKLLKAFSVGPANSIISTW